MRLRLQRSFGLGGAGGWPAAAILFVALMSLASEALAQNAALVLDAIEVSGNSRTTEETIARCLPVRAGESVTPERLIAAVDALRRSELFESVDFSSRRGVERGHVVLVLDVVEKGVEFRLGAGYQDLNGWYLIPAELRMDNRLGHGEQTRLHLKIGYRHAGLVFAYEEPQIGDGRDHWGFSFSALGNERVYFYDSVEYGHIIGKGVVEAHVGRELTSRLSLEVGGRFEKVDADSFASAREDDEIRGVSTGDELPFEELPPQVARALGEREHGVVRIDLGWDSRGAERLAGSPATGVWGRVRAEGYFGEDDAYPILSADLRGYRSLGRAALAARVRGGVLGREAPFYDRFYVGGLYTVRGFPSQSLSAPGGETAFWSASIELRTPLIGEPARPRLAGVLFADAADAWTDGAPTWSDVAASAGYGLRLRAPWVGWLGLDIGAPLTDSPVGEAIHGHASIGWTY